MSYGIEVRVHGEQSFNGNQIRLWTTEEAEAYARDLYSRWTLVAEWRIIEINAEANYRFIGGKLEPIHGGKDK